MDITFLLWTAVAVQFFVGYLQERALTKLRLDHEGLTALIVTAIEEAKERSRVRHEA